MIVFWAHENVPGISLPANLAIRPLRLECLITSNVQMIMPQALCPCLTFLFVRFALSSSGVNGPVCPSDSVYTQAVLCWYKRVKHEHRTIWWLHLLFFR
jgi:hypothetical protein